MRPHRVVSGVGCAGAACLLAVAACSSFGSDTAMDAGGIDGSVADADAGTPPDAPPSADGGSFVPCAARSPAPAFCDDFDDGNMKPESDWSVPVTTPDAGSIDYTADARSAPRAVSYRLAPSAGTSSTARLIKKLPGTILAGKTKMTFSFALRVDEGPYASGATGPGYMIVGSIFFDDTKCSATPTANGKERSLSLVFSPPGKLALAVKSFQAECSDGGSDFVGVATDINTSYFSTFNRIELTVAKGSCPGSGIPSLASVTVHGASLPGPTCAGLALDPFAPANTIGVTVGLVGGDGPHPAVRTTADDVLFELE